MRILLIDNYDSFTYNLYDYLLRCGVEVIVVRNDEWTLAEFKAFDFDGLVISPGPSRPADAGIMNQVLAYFYDKKPVLGICLGHQAIGEFFGAELVKARLPVHGKTSVIQHDGQGIFKDLPREFQVMRYHSLILKDLEGIPLQATAFTYEGEIMGLRHSFLPISGVQFHPESILTEYGLPLLNNWLESIRVTIPHT